MVPMTWEDFKKKVGAEFIPSDHVRRARDKLRRLKHTSSISKYLAEFRNIILTIPDVTDDEKLDRFCSGLKYEIRVEVLKSGVDSLMQGPVWPCGSIVLCSMLEEMMS